MAEGDLSRSQAIAQSAAVAAIARAYNVTTYQAGTWQRHQPKLVLRSTTGAPFENYAVQFHVQHHPGKVREVVVKLTEHHAGGMYPSSVMAFRATSRQLFLGNMTVDGEFRSWQVDDSRLNDFD